MRCPVPEWGAHYKGGSLAGVVGVDLVRNESLGSLMFTGGGLLPLDARQICRMSPTMYNCSLSFRLTHTGLLEWRA